MNRVHLDWYKYRHVPPAPKTLEDCKDLCGWAGPNTAEQHRTEVLVDSEDFEIVGATESSEGKSARLWDVYRSVAKHEPDLTPQPTGCCVADGLADAIDALQCVEIFSGEREEFHPLYSPYLYATSRVLVLNNRLKGGQGSTGSAAAKAIKLYGSIPARDGLPTYTKHNIDSWGDGRTADGQDFRDFLDEGDDHPVKTFAYCDVWEAVRDALFNGFPLTIASSRGYQMRAGNDGFHDPSGTWNHQMSIHGYSEEGPESQHWVGIKNQWGNQHGTIIDFTTGEEWPRGMLRVRKKDFIKYHLGLRGCECICYSGFVGFPSKREKLRIHLDW